MRALIVGLVTLTFLAACAPPPTPEWTDLQIEEHVVELMTVPACLSQGLTMDPSASVARNDRVRQRLHASVSAERIAAAEIAAKAKYAAASFVTRDRCTMYSMVAISEANKKRDAAAKAAIDAQSSANLARINAMNNNGAALIQAIGNNRQCIHTSWNNSVSCI